LATWGNFWAFQASSPLTTFIVCLKADVAAAERSGAVRGKNLQRIGELEKFGVQAVVKHRGQLARPMIAGEIGAVAVAPVSPPASLALRTEVVKETPLL
jgi:hypothetical protein